jgi:Spy/CpxP family protein refolding chaperone
MFMAEGPGMMLPLLIRRADLTPDQQARVRTIIATDHRSLRALFDDLRAAQDELVAKLVAPGALDAKDLTPQMDRVVQLRQQLMQQGIKTALAVRAVLTPAQLAKAAETKDRLQKLRAEMRTLMEGQ